MKGFTLIEMLVSIAIFTIVTSIVIYNYGAFNSNIQVTNLAYEMALAIRQAQVYGLSVKTQGGNSPDYAYGIYFDINKTDKFYLYADKDVPLGEFDTNSISNCDGTGECQEEFTIRGDVSIIDLCVTNSSGEDCGRNELNIIFLRPNPEAIIFPDQLVPTNYGLNDPNNPVILNYKSAKITIEGSRSGKQKDILIERTGQISVQ